MMNFLFQIAVILSVLCFGNGQNTQKIVDFSCERKLEILTNDVLELINDWIPVKRKIYGERNVQINYIKILSFEYHFLTQETFLRLLATTYILNF